MEIDHSSEIHNKNKYLLKKEQSSKIISMSNFGRLKSEFLFKLVVKDPNTN